MTKEEKTPEEFLLYYLEYAKRDLRETWDCGKFKRPRLDAALAAIWREWRK